MLVSGSVMVQIDDYSCRLMLVDLDGYNSLTVTIPFRLDCEGTQTTKQPLLQKTHKFQV